MSFLEVHSYCIAPDLKRNTRVYVFQAFCVWVEMPLSESSIYKLNFYIIQKDVSYINPVLSVVAFGENKTHRIYV